MIRIINRKKQWLLLLFLFTGIVANAQCDYRLVEEAAQRAGSNTVYLRDFKVRLSEASIDDPVPTGKFPVYLNEGAKYRFTIANAANLDGKAMFEIERRGQSYASNMNNDQIYRETFDFNCERSATYQLLINFGDGQEGCAAVVMSLILDDSLSYIEPHSVEKDSLETLYLWSDNELQIATTLGKDFVVNATISQGEIVQDGKFFIVRPERQGELDVYVSITNKNGDFQEGDTVTYLVDIPSFPIILLPSERMGSIFIREFTGLELVKVESDFYKLKQFRLSKYSSGMSNLVSYTHKLTIDQINFVKNLSSGESFFITDIEFIDPNNKVHRGFFRQVFIVE